ncbi:LCP family protein required for cell wall assembly [Bacillus pakistanensis]|uniref:LCP family protein required for cell wall assembly n=1 Tax=Rossellomorea pakistanensis TaxID=992288 RepID=A0ABS2ND37_9BACI|nr:LCP family protein [Bacillus pakistanensis]MBM7585772.1 LCP family protein required for cell wall assembly [Bacillus pakistanensis]
MNRQELKIKKRKSKRRIIKRILLSFLLIFTVAIGYFAYVFLETYQAASNSYDDIGREKSKLRDEAVTILKDPVSVLIMGVEDYSSGGANGRSDTLMVATFNPKDATMNLVSIPRDTRVPMPDTGALEKINHSFAYGGKEETIETVENFLDIPIDYYVTINFEAFKDIVDVLGGITVEVPFDFTQNSDDRIAEELVFTEGPMKLNGREALAYARMRLQDPRGDIGRNERQKQVVQAVIDELASGKTLFKVDEIADVVGTNVETNLMVSDGLAFFRKYSSFDSSNIKSLTIEGAPEYIGGVSYFIPDEEELIILQEKLQKHLEHDSKSTMTESESEEY